MVRHTFALLQYAHVVGHKPLTRVPTRCACETGTEAEKRRSASGTLATRLEEGEHVRASHTQYATSIKLCGMRSGDSGVLSRREAHSTPPRHCSEHKVCAR